MSGQTAPADLAVVHISSDSPPSPPASPRPVCLMDSSHVTGSLAPVSLAPGSSVPAGSLILRGEVIGEVTAIGADTVMGKLVGEGKFPMRGREEGGEEDTEGLLEVGGESDKGL